MKNFILFLCFTVLAFVSCKKNNDHSDSNTNSNQLYPLKIGNSWTYNEKEYNEDGTLKSSVTGTTIVTGTVIKNGNTYFILNDEKSPMDTALLMRSDDQNVWVFARNTNKQTLWFKWPVTSGEVLSALSENEFTQEYKASTATVNINGFSGYKVFYTAQFRNVTYSTSELYYKPQVGLIGSVQYNTKFGSGNLFKQYESQLLSYDLK